MDVENGPPDHATAAWERRDDTPETDQSSDSRDTNIAVRLKNKNDHGWRRIVRNFTPSWFTVTMGTGLVAVLLETFPWNADWLYYLSIIVFCFNIGLFSIFIGVSLIRYTVWPEIWSAMIHHPNQALFVGAVPMSLSTIVNMIVFVCVPAWGIWTGYFAWALWMVDAILSMASAIYMPFLLIKKTQEADLRMMTALQLLPVIATVVAAASAGVVAAILPHPQQALATVIVGYVLWGIGVPSSFMLLVIYFQRLAVYKIPPREIIVSTFLPLGPLNMGAFGIMQLGNVALRLFPRTNTILPLAGEIVYTGSVILGLIMWSFSLLWFFFAVASIVHSKKFPFNMGWWGFVFPIGTFALSSNKLATEIPSLFFRVIGAIATVCVCILWIIVALATLKDAWRGGGRIFSAPCLQDLDERKSGDVDRMAKKA